MSSFIMARLWFVPKSLFFLGEDLDQVQVSSFYCFTLFTERLINIVYRTAEIKKYKQIS